MKPSIPPVSRSWCLIGILLPLVACHHGRSVPAVTPVSPVFVGPVTIAPNGNPWVPLAAVLSLQTDVPTTVELRISDGERTWDAVADPNLATDHSLVPVVGMRPGRAHDIEVTVRDANGATTAAPEALHFTTPPLPANFPPIAIDRSMPRYMEDGVTLLSLMSNDPGCMPTMIDAEGEVVWYFDCSLTPFGQEQVMAFPLKNGNLMLIAAWKILAEVDLLGGTVQLFSATGLTSGQGAGVSVDTDSFHHDFIEMPAGSGADYAVLGTELRSFTNYPNDVVDPTQTSPTADVVGDEIVEFDRDGTVVRRIRLLDLLDPYRMVYDTLGDFWDDFYGMPTADWSHANAIVYDAGADAWIVSLRHQDCLVKIDRSTETVEWILGDPSRWNPPWSEKLLTPVGPGFAWPYHQHAPQLQPDGTLFLFDNGNHRAIPPSPGIPFGESYSRAVRFRVDEAARTVEQLWAYGGPPGTAPTFFSFFVGSGYRMPATGNVLVCDGGKMLPGGRLFGHVFEITTELIPQVVFECNVQSDGTTSTANHFVYRAYRLPGVYF